MGRETKLLLALLGLLAGVFLGVTSMKLFVPRPPAGAGPDVHSDIALTEAQALVEPPDLSPPAPPADAVAATSAPPPPDAASPDNHGSATLTSRFGGGAMTDAVSDPFVVAASYEAAEQLPAPLSAPDPPAAPAPPAIQQPPADLQSPPSFQRPVSPPASLVDPGSPPPLAAPLGKTYVAQAGDSWWLLAERAYGDGRLYRALFAWNRMIDPRVTLAPGTHLELPPAAQLGASWPGLLPRD